MQVIFTGLLFLQLFREIWLTDVITWQMVEIHKERDKK